MILSTKDNFLLKNEKLFIFILICVSSLIRLKINFSTEFIPGNNGAFYLLLNRNLLEKGELIHRDFPLIFYLQSFLSLLLIKTNLLNEYNSIDFVTRVFDSFAPAFSIFPSYLIVKEIIKEKKLVVLAIASLSIYNFSFFTLISDFQKNSLAILWMLFLIYYLFKLNQKFNYKNLLLTILFFVLTGLTHFGCFGVVIFIILINFLVSSLKNYSYKKIIYLFGVVFITITFSFLIVYLINPFRFYSLIKIIQSIFSYPAIQMIIKKEPIITPYDFIQIILSNVITLFSFYLLGKSRFAENTIFIVLTFVSFILSSPIINYEIAQRLYLISYVPTIPLIAFIFTKSSYAVKKLVLIITTLVIIFSIIISVNKKTYSNMNKKIYTEIEKMKEFVNYSAKPIIVSRHGLEFWITFITRIDAIREDEFSSKYYEWYNEVYFLIQKKDKSPFGPAGTFGLPFKEPIVPNKAKLIYSSDYIDLYKTNN